jgi:hypothetical protein
MISQNWAQLENGFVVEGIKDPATSLKPQEMIGRGARI